MDIDIIKVTDSRQLSKFVMFPFKLYKTDENWVPPLIKKTKLFLKRQKNPFFDHSEATYFLAYKKGELVGRISAHTNTQHNKTHDDKIGFFGFFDSVNDQEVADRLVKVASNELLKKGFDTIRGPMNFTVNDECGLLIEGFDSPPCIMMTYNYSYYQKILENTGLKKAKDLYAYHLKQDYIPERIERIAGISQKRGNFKIRSLSNQKSELKKDIEDVFTVYTKAWEKNWGFVPLTRSEFDSTVRSLLPIVDTDIVFLATVNDEPVGFSLALPDYNQVLKHMNGRIFPLGFLKFIKYKKNINRLRVMAMGVVKEHQKKGIDSVFYFNTFKNGFKKGYYEGEFSWVLEDNVDMNNIAEKLGAKVYKKYRILEKKLK